MNAPAFPKLPSAVIRFVERAFAKANRDVCLRIARVPNSPEESLDMLLIDSLAAYRAPQVVCPGWAVRIDTHFLGGMRHFMNRWEIADIGLLLFAKKNAQVVARKAALLQSKRLYPSKGSIVEDSEEDYRIGFGRLLPSALSTSLAMSQAFEFGRSSQYKALRVGDEQWMNIAAYEEERNLAVHYLLYNPWNLAARYTFPHTTPQASLGRESNAGCRVVPYKTFSAALATRNVNYSPSFADAETAMAKIADGSAGWTLEKFVARELLECRQGNLFEDLADPNIFALFNRRSGPIAAAVSVTIEEFDA